MCNIPFQTGNQDWDTDSSIDDSFEDNGNNPEWTGRVSLPRQYSDYPTSTAVFDSPNESFHLDYNGNTNGYKIPVRFKLSSSSLDRLEFRFTFEIKVVDSKGLFQTVQNEINYLSTNYNEQYNQSIGSHNSISSFGSSEQKNFGAMNRFSNTKLNLWENFSYVFNLSENYINNEDTNNLQNMWFIIQSSGIGVNTGFNGTVYLDDFEIRESYEFQPDVDVRMKKGPDEYGTADLTKYYDKNIKFSLNFCSRKALEIPLNNKTPNFVIELRPYNSEVRNRRVRNPHFCPIHQKTAIDSLCIGDHAAGI